MSSHTPAPRRLAQLSTIPQLRAAYARGELTATAVAAQITEALSGAGAELAGIFIERVAPDVLLAAARALDQRRARGDVMPLFGIPFAVKDNIDVAGLPTTAACPGYAYQANASAPVVERLITAGALLIGKTNLDQFATGLVGVRSPYGVPANPFDARYITGGSSSGSAAAVSRGLVSFALGTDTAGSGRVPAAFTNVVGLKPSGGLFSTRGVVPACRSLDCVSIFALTIDDAREVATVMSGYDPSDPFSRPEATGFAWTASRPTHFRCGVLSPAQREFFGDAAAAAAYDTAIERCRQLGATVEEIDFAPFLEAAALLYEGPWIAERLAELEAFVKAHPEALLPVTREILREGAARTGTEVFRGWHRLMELRQLARATFRRFDVLLMPTTATIYKQDEIAREPRLRNARLGRYVNFVNLLELAGVAVPNGFRPDGLPTGVTLLGPWGSDARLLTLAGAFHDLVGGPLGATGVPLAPQRPAETSPLAADVIRLAVVGAHLTGQPLNHQLTDGGARLVTTTRTAPLYRLYALPGTTPPKPGLVRVGAGQTGNAIEVELWDLPHAMFAGFFARIAAPLGLGRIALESGGDVAGFLCESHAVADAEDISRWGGWRGYLARRG
ncbi:MAG TPA: allophanate hydrolase [Polyangia bacterium]